MEQRVREQIARIVKERLGLSEAESERLSALVRDYDGRRRELARNENEMRRRVESLVEDGPVTDEAARALLTGMIEHRRAEAALFAEEQAALLELLTPVQILQLQHLRDELGRRIRSLRGGDDDRRRRRGGGDVDPWVAGGLSLGVGGGTPFPTWGRAALHGPVTRGAPRGIS